MSNNAGGILGYHRRRHRLQDRSQAHAIHRQKAANNRPRLRKGNGDRDQREARSCHPPRIVPVAEAMVALVWQTIFCAKERLESKTGTGAKGEQKSS